MKKIVVVYGELNNPMQKKALKQISSIVLELTMEYPVCIKYSDLADMEKLRCIYIGTKKDNPLIAKASERNLTQKEQYYIKVSEDSVIIEGYDDAGVLYGCIDFYNEYIVKYENSNNS